MGWVHRNTSSRGRRLWSCGVGLILVGLISWLTLPYRSDAHFWVSFGCYGMGLILSWGGVSLSNRDVRFTRDSAIPGQTVWKAPR